MPLSKQKKNYSLTILQNEAIEKYGEKVKRSLIISTKNGKPLPK
jgi:hypothetical protein